MLLNRSKTRMRARANANSSSPIGEGINKDESALKSRVRQICETACAPLNELLSYCCFHVLRSRWPVAEVSVAEQSNSLSRLTQVSRATHSSRQLAIRSSYRRTR